MGFPLPNLSEEQKEAVAGMKNKFIYHRLVQRAYLGQPALVRRGGKLYLRLRYVPEPISTFLNYRRKLKVPR